MYIQTMTYYLISAISSSTPYYLVRPNNVGDPYNLATTDINSATQFITNLPGNKNYEISFSPYPTSSFISNNYGQGNPFQNNYLIENNIQSLWLLYPVVNGYTTGNVTNINNKPIPNGQYIINLVGANNTATTDWWKFNFGNTPNITNDSVNKVGEFPTQDKTINTPVISEYIFTFTEFVPTAAVVSSTNLIAISNPQQSNTEIHTCHGSDCCIFPSDNNYNSQFDYSTSNGFVNLSINTITGCNNISNTTFSGKLLDNLSYYFTRTDLSLYIAEENNNLYPNFSIIKHFGTKGVLIQFNDRYLFLSKYRCISQRSLYNLNKWGSNHNIPILFPLRNTVM